MYYYYRVGLAAMNIGVIVLFNLAYRAIGIERWRRKNLMLISTWRRC